MGDLVPLDRNTLLYLAGPMTHELEHGRPAFAEATKRLLDVGYYVEDRSRVEVPDWSWETYLRHDLKAMLDCTGVAVLPGWEFSRGAQLEVQTARALAMPIRPVEQWLAMAP